MSAADLNLCDGCQRKFPRREFEIRHGWGKRTEVQLCKRCRVEGLIRREQRQAAAAIARRQKQSDEKISRLKREIAAIDQERSTFELHVQAARECAGRD